MTPYLEKVEGLWHDTASMISFHHADDSGKEWGHARAMKPLLLALETEIKRRGGKRPDGSKYLIAGNDRIEWEVSA